MCSDETKRGTLLIVEDCEVERNGLKRGLRPCFEEVVTVGTLAEALSITSAIQLSAALLDLALPDGSSLDLIPFLRSDHPSISIVILTGFGSYAAAVDAIKLGAHDFLAKPVSFEQILAALDGTTALSPRKDGACQRPVPLTLARVEWETINRVLSESNWNISEAARRLGVQRQSLQRKLRKLPPPLPVAGRHEEAASTCKTRSCRSGNVPV